MVIRKNRATNVELREHDVELCDLNDELPEPDVERQKRNVDPLELDAER